MFDFAWWFLFISFTIYWKARSNICYGYSAKIPLFLTKNVEKLRQIT